MQSEAIRRKFNGAVSIVTSDFDRHDRRVSMKRKKKKEKMIIINAELLGHKCDLCAAWSNARVSLSTRLFVFVERFASAFRVRQCVGKRVNRRKRQPFRIFRVFAGKRRNLFSEELNETNIYAVPRARDRDLFTYGACKKNPFCCGELVVNVAPRYVRHSCQFEYTI